MRASGESDVLKRSIDGERALFFTVPVGLAGERALLFGVPVGPVGERVMDFTLQ